VQRARAQTAAWKGVEVKSIAKRQKVLDGDGGTERALMFCPRSLHSPLCSIWNPYGMGGFQPPIPWIP